jgi:RepB DNA-primase from phage plasmid
VGNFAHISNKVNHGGGKIEGTELQPNPAETERFLAPFGDRFTLQTFDDDKKRGSRELVRVRHGAHGRHVSELAELNCQGAGIFVVPNETDGRGRKTENVVSVRALFVDLDKDGPRKLDAVLVCDCQPDIVVESSLGKFHCYWLHNDRSISLGQFKPLQQKLASKFGGDPAVCDLPHVMRLPGYWHQKDPANPFMTRIVSIRGEGRYEW